MNSSILNSSDYYFRHLGNFLENAVGDNSHWLLCFRATLHGWNVSQFHSRCDGKYDTVTIIRKGKLSLADTRIFLGVKKLIPLFYRPFLLQCNSFTILIYLHCLLEFNSWFIKLKPERQSWFVTDLVMMVKCFCLNEPS